MAKLTVKQENFVQVYIETGNASEAYRRAYSASRMKPESVNRLAFALLGNIKITSRIEALQSEHRKRHDVTTDSISDELEEARLQALNDGQPSAAVSASMGKAKLHGLLTDRAETKMVLSGDMTTDKAMANM